MSVLDVFDTEVIDQRARRMNLGVFWRRIGRFLLALVTLVFAGVGWIAGAAIYAVTWIFAAVAEGYAAGRRKRTGGS